MISRTIIDRLKRALARGKSVLLLGARQVGKTTLVRTLDSNRYISFANPKVRLDYEKEPERLMREIDALDVSSAQLPLIILDEVQKVPKIMDVVQEMIDNNKAQFVLTGSSLLKLKNHHDLDGVNLLPGRVIKLQLDPLTFEELSPVPEIRDLLLFGGLPGIVYQTNDADKEEDLQSYVTTYLEEEVRVEARLRDMAPFSRFLELAASESGNIINVSKLSQDIGVATHTISGYFEILKDCLMIEQIEPVTQSSTRRKLTKAPKFIFSDLGIRRTCALEGLRLPREYMGRLFEQYVALQLIQINRARMGKAKLRYWRTENGQKIDWVLEKEKQHIPIEVKFIDSPNAKHTKHLQLFLDEYESATQAYIICQTPLRQKLTDQIIALPWQELCSII